MDNARKNTGAKPAKVRTGDRTRMFALQSAAAMAFVLTGALAERLAQMEHPGARDWIMTGAALGITAILFLMVVTGLAGRKSGAEASTIPEGEAAVFDLDPSMNSGGAGSRDPDLAPRTIGNLARSIREASNEVAEITDQLATAHEGNSRSGANGGNQGFVRDLVDHQGEALLKIDEAAKEASRVAAENAKSGEILAAIHALSTIHAAQGNDHAKALAEISTLAATVLREAHDAVAQARIFERDRDALAREAHESFSGLETMLRVIDEALIQFHDLGKSLDAPNESSDVPVTDAVHDDITMNGLQDVAAATRGLATRVGKVSECLQAIRVQHRMMQSSPRLQRAVEAGMDEAESVLREVRDAASMIEINLEREAGKAARAMQAMKSGVAQREARVVRLEQRGHCLSRMSGDLAQAMGKIRLSAQAESARVGQFLSRASTSQATGTMQPLLQGLLENASGVAHSSNRIAIDSQRVCLDAARIAALSHDLKASKDASLDHVNQLQKASGIAAAKVESLVGMVQTLISREDSSTRRSAANTARFAIRDKVAMIDHFARRVLELEERSKRMRGPSPALDRSEMESLPEYNVPVQ